MKINNIIAQIKSISEKHQGISELKRFGENLKSKALTIEEFKIFFATLWPFYKETSSGILKLALRINDFWESIDPWDANAKAAYLLSASVDEFGLKEMKNSIPQTHHQLFQSTAIYFGVSNQELYSPHYSLLAGIEMGKVSREYYRKKKLSKALGFHLASELTSWLEFKCFLEGFLEYKTEYSIKDKNDPALKFFYVHTLIEPSHLDYSEKIINSYCEVTKNSAEDIIFGLNVYMNYYTNLFMGLNEKIYSRNNTVIHRT